MTDTDTFPDIDLSSASLEDTDTPRTRKPRSDAGKPRGRAASTKSLQEDLLVPWAMLASSVAMVAPTASAVLLKQGEQTVNAIIGIAKDHPKMMAALKKAGKMGPGVHIANTVLCTGIAVALDFGRIPPEHPLAVNLGVSDVYNEVRREPTEEELRQMQLQFGPPPAA